MRREPPPKWVRRALWRTYRNLLIIAAPLIALCLSAPPLLRAISSGAGTPFDDALQYFPPFTIIIVYVGATLIAVLILLALLGLLLVPMSVLLRVRLHQHALMAVVALNTGGVVTIYALMLRLSSQMATPLDVVSIVFAALCIGGVQGITLARPKRRVPAAPNQQPAG